MSVDLVNAMIVRSGKKKGVFFVPKFLQAKPALPQATLLTYTLSVAPLTAVCSFAPLQA